MADAATTPDVSESMAYAFHTLSSYGWFEEPAQDSSGTVLGDLPERGDRLAGDEGDALTRLLAARTSRRTFTGEPIERDALRLLLWSGYGRTAERPAEQRTVPSAGGTYALRLIVVGLRVGSGAAGMLEFDPTTAALEPLPGPDVDADVLATLFRTRHVRFDQAAAVVFLTGRWGPPLGRYGERGYRYLMLEAGHVGQNLCLGATALRIGHVPLGGFDDDATRALLTEHGVDAFPIYAVTLGATEHGVPEIGTLLDRVWRED